MRAFLCICASFFCLSLSAQEVSEPQLWSVLYQGNWSLGHKMILNRQTSSTNDELLSQFMMAYLKYKSGQEDEIDAIFKGIDRYVDHYYINGAKRG